MSKGILAFCLLIIFLPACSTDIAELREEAHFLERDPQPVTHRTVIDTLHAVRSVVLSDLEIFVPGQIRVHNERVYISEIMAGEIVGLDVETLTVDSRVRFERGQGPGEVNGLPTFEVTNRHFLVPSLTNRRLIIRTIDGGPFEDIHLDDAPPFLLAVLNDETIALYSPESTSALFHLVDSTGRRQSAFVSHGDTPWDILRYNGALATDGDDLYFAGYSESLLKRISREGTTRFSVELVDGFPAEANYIEFSPGSTQRGIQYSPSALLSALAVSIWEEFVVVVPGHDDDGNRLPLLDFYRKANGEYTFSLAIESPGGKLAVGRDRFYILARVDGEVTLFEYQLPAL
jgi:hypothetical protein